LFTIDLYISWSHFIILTSSVLGATRTIIVIDRLVAKILYVKQNTEGDKFAMVFSGYET